MARRFVTLSDEEIVKCIEALDEYNCAPERKVQLRALYLVLSNLGLRVSEAISLRWKDFDFARKEVTVETLKSQGRRAQRAKRVMDTLPVDAETLKAVAACRNGARPSDLLFPIGRGAAYNIWQRLMALAQVKPRKLHALRHAAVTRWLETTQDLAFAQFMARHENVTTTGQYVHVTRLHEKFEQVPKVSVKFEPPPPRVEAPAPPEATPEPIPPPPQSADNRGRDDVSERMERLEEGFFRVAAVLERFLDASRPVPPPIVAAQQRALPPVPGRLREKLAVYGLDAPAELGRAARTTRQHAWRLLAGERYGVTIAKRIAAAVRQPWPDVLAWQDGPGQE